MPASRPIVQVRGTVSSALIRSGTGSEHTAVVLRTDTGETLVLVRHGGNPFSDAQTKRLIGSRVDATGYRIGNELRFIEAKAV